MFQAKFWKKDQISKEFTFSLSNFRGKYHNSPIRRFMKDNMPLAFKVPVIRTKV